MCLTPPTKETLVAKIQEGCLNLANAGQNTRPLQLLIDLLSGKKSADTAFLVQVLHLCNPSDEIFATDYLYVRPRKVKAQVAMPLVDNSDGFFNGLPALSSRAKGKKGHQQLRLTKAQKRNMQLKVLENRQFELANKINALRSAAASEACDGANNAGAASAQNHSVVNSRSHFGEEGEAEQQEMNQSRGPNIIYNAEEVEAEQEEMPGSGPNLASPYVRMQSQEPGGGLSSAVNAARQRQANARNGRVSDFSAARNGF